jgi:hypothetical protein
LERVCARLDREGDRLAALIRPRADELGAAVELLEEERVA